MPIRVPVNPQTDPVAKFESFTPEGRAHDVTGVFQGASDLANSIERVRDRRDLELQKKVNEQKQLDDFDLSHKALIEFNQRSADLQERAKAADAGALGFADRVQTDYDATNQQLITEAQKAGYDPLAVAKFKTQLEHYNSGFYTQALNIQQQRGKVNAGVALDNTDDELSRYYVQHPDATASVKEQLRQFVYSRPELNEDEKAVEFARRWDRLKVPGANAYVRDHAREVLEQYAPHLIPQPLLTTTAPGAASSGPFNLNEYMGKMGPVEGTARNLKSSAIGFGQFLKNTWAGAPGGTGVYQQVFGNTGETREQILAKRNDPAVAKQVAEQFTKNNVTALEKAGVPVNNTSVYMAHFLGAGDAVKVAEAPLDAPINSVVTPASIKANPSVFKQGMTVEDFLRWCAGKMGAETNEQGLVQPTVPVGPATELKSEEVEAIKTNIPALAELDGQQLLQVISTAQSTLVQQQQQAAAAQRELTAEQRAAHEVRVNSLYNGLTDGTMTQVDLDKAYKDGWLTDYDERHKAQEIIDQKLKKNEDLDRYSQMWTTGGAFNPFDKQAQDAVEAGFTKALEIAADPSSGKGAASPLGIAMAIWDRTGIFPKQGTVMLRGGLASPDPTLVAASAGVAANMLAKNPNVFAGVDGGDDITKQAANYQHFINDLGMSAPEAAARLANMNKPEVKRSINANSPERQQFSKALGEVDIATMLNRAVGNPKSVLPFNIGGATQLGFATPGQQAEAAQTYSELAMDHFDQYHDPAAAQAYAERQMSRFYGMNHGRLTKFPPSKAYPLVGGSQDYVIDQAREEVVKYSGLDIPADRVWLEPSPSGTTAQAFRAGQRVPYELHYISRVNGHDVYNVIPGKLFVADVERAKRELGDTEKTRQRDLRNINRIRTEYGLDNPIGMP